MPLEMQKNVSPKGATFAPDVLPAVNRCTFDNYQSIHDLKLRLSLDEPTVLQGESRVHDYSWRYDVPQVRQDIETGNFSIPLETVERDFLDWVDDSRIVTIRDMASGDKFRKLSSKRGNQAYASKQRKRFSDIDRGIDAIVNEHLPIPGSKGAMTRVLLVTFTHDPKIVLTELEAWKKFTSRLNQWKVQAKRVFQANHMSVLCAREACGGEGENRDYPHPHAIVILSHPVMAFRYVSKQGKHRGKVSYRVNDETLRTELKRVWPYGNLDIQAIVGGRVVVDGKEQRATQYILKYITKSINISADPKQTEIDVGVRTMALTKLFHCAPVNISADLRRTLAAFVRLDSMMSTLQQRPVRIWRFESVLCCRSADVIRHLVEHPPPDMCPWPVAGVSLSQRL